LHPSVAEIDIPISGYRELLTSLLTTRPVAESYITFIVVFECVVSKKAYDPVDMKTLSGKNTHRT